MDEFVKLITGIAWPAIVLAGFWYFRAEIASGVVLLQRQLAAGAAVKWKDFEFTGVNIHEFAKGDSSGYSVHPAKPSDLDQRNQKYREQKNLFLVHRVLATGKVHAETNQPTFDVLIQLVSHKHYGHLNDVKKVEYYLGKYFGRDLGKCGAKYVVENGSDGFAVRVDAYGPTLCEATLYFHDGTIATCSRYLDFGGTSYIYDSAVSNYDAKLSGGKK